MLHLQLSRENPPSRVFGAPSEVETPRTRPKYLDTFASVYFGASETVPQVLPEKNFLFCSYHVQLFPTWVSSSSTDRKAPCYWKVLKTNL